MLSGRELGVLEPRFWKFVLAVGHILAAKDAELEHFPGRKLGPEIRIKIFAYRLAAFVRIAALHGIADNNPAHTTSLPVQSCYAGHQYNGTLLVHGYDSRSPVLGIRQDLVIRLYIRRDRCSVFVFPCFHFIMHERMNPTLYKG